MAALGRSREAQRLASLAASGSESCQKREDHMGNKDTSAGDVRAQALRHLRELIES
jgi:hypothetical protein